MLYRLYMAKKSHTLMYPYTSVTDYKTVKSFSVFVNIRVPVLFAFRVCGPISTYIDQTFYFVLGFFNKGIFT